MGFWFRSSEDEKKRKACRYLVQRLPAIGLDSCLTGYRRSELDRAHSLTLLTVLRADGESENEEASKD
jgi:hypothetical protein